MAPTFETPVGQIWAARNRRVASGRTPVVLIHGAGGSHLHWPAELRNLPGSEVLAVDLPGHGRSPGPGRDSIAGYAEVVQTLMAALAMPRAILCGHSMGGAIAQWLALERPGLVAGLVLVGTGAKLRVAPELVGGVLDDTESAVVLMVDWSYGPAASPVLKAAGLSAMRQVDPAVLYGDLVACDRFDTRQRLPEIQAPTLVIGATADRMTPWKFSQYLADQIPRAELVTIQDAGHMMTLEAPDQVAAAVSRFVMACEVR